MKTTISACIPHRFRGIFCSAVLTLAALLATPGALAQVNKCLDTSGKVVGYGSECPAGTRSEATNIRNAPTAAAPGAGGKSSSSAANPSGPKTIAEQEADFRKRQMEKQEAQAKADKTAADQQARATACENARSYLKSLQSGTRMVRTDPKTGERVFFEEADYARETARVQRAVDENCK
ncbi:MAG: DUF4124 domain-containing protein [Rhodospirillaceae bacterium]